MCVFPFGQRLEWTRRELGDHPLVVERSAPSLSFCSSFSSLVRAVIL